MSKHQIYTTSSVTLHVSVWVEILAKLANSVGLPVTLHVSVWVEIIVFNNFILHCLSRSTWACELKLKKAMRSTRSGKDYLYFNSHAHVERDLQILLLFYLPYHFNSHAHVERDWLEILLDKNYYISTHTLTWSVTIPVIHIMDVNAISTHTLTWSVTHLVSLVIIVNRISTHTLTWSVTM